MTAVPHFGRLRLSTPVPAYPGVESLKDIQSGNYQVTVSSNEKEGAGEIWLNNTLIASDHSDLLALEYGMRYLAQEYGEKSDGAEKAKTVVDFEGLLRRALTRIIEDLSGPSQLQKGVLVKTVTHPFSKFAMPDNPLAEFVRGGK